jgi:hypothetical protein
VTRISRGSGAGYLFKARKSITFNGTTVGAVGANSIFSVTGTVIIEKIIPRVTANLTSGGAATVAMGVDLNGQFFIAPTAYSALVNNDIWLSDTSQTNTGAELTNGVKDHVTGDRNIIIDVAAAAVTGGSIDIDVFYRPVSPGAVLVAL